MLNKLWRWAAIAVALSGPMAAAAADEVTLSFPDGSFEVTGPLLGFDGAAYRIDTRFGVLTIAANRVLCMGACPTRTDPPLIRLVGAAAMAEVLMPSLVDAFALSLGVSTQPAPAEPDTVALDIVAGEAQVLARFEITATTTAAGFAALATNQAEIALADRDVSPAEAEALRAAGLGDVTDPLRRRLLARRPLTLLEPDAFPQRDLTVAELLVAAGQGANWATFGGPDIPVAMAALPVDGLPARARLDALGAYHEESRAPALRDLDSASDLSAFFEAEPGAAILTHERLGNGRAVSLSHGCEPGSADRAEGDAHPLMIHFWSYTAAPRLPDLARAFLIFASGPDAQRVVDRAGFLDKRPRPIPLADQGERVARAVSALSAEKSLEDLQAALGRLQGFDRLSTVFRFAPNSAELNLESVAEAQSLAALLDSGRYDGREVLFVGLTDALGTAESNIRLSEARASLARDAVARAMATRADRVELKAEGLGELFPLACDASAWGRHVNRRVEVWLGPSP